MADFYTILRTAVGDSVGYDREARELLYRRAREALKMQLDSLETPLSEEQKAAQMAQLDEAAQRVEAEFSAAEAVPVEDVAGEEAGGLDAEPRDGDEAGEEAAAHKAAHEAAEEAPQAEEPGEPDAPAEVGAAAVPQQVPARQATPPEAASTEVAPEAVPSEEIASERAQVLSGQDGEAAPARPRTTRRIAPPRRERKAGSGRSVLIILLLVILGGGGYFAWRWQDVAPAIERMVESVQAMLGDEQAAPSSGAQGKETAAGGAEPAGQSQKVAPEPEREMARTPDGELKGTVPPEPAENDDQAAGASQPDDTAGSQAAEAGAGQREVLAEKEIEPAPGPQKDQDRVAPTVPAAERAFMIIEQGATGSDDLRFAGSAQWRLEGSGGEAVVTVTVQIPERSALIGFAMRRNNDESLPASHTVDISYQGGTKEDGPIINVPGFMVRVAESETPVPMRSAGALIMPGQYLLGLSGSKEDEAHNLSLLDNAQWFEVPAMFESKRRLVLVVEVGESGSAALKGALEQWNEAGAGQAQQKAGE